MNVKLSKKAAMGPAPSLLDFAAFIGIMIFLVISAIIFSFHSALIENKISEISVTHESGYLLLNMLRTPVNVEGADNAAELISLWYMDPDKYEAQLKEKISKILSEFYDSKADWELAAEEKRISSAAIDEMRLMANLKVAIAESEAIIPLHYSPDKLLIKIKLSAYITAVNEGAWCFSPTSTACSKDMSKLCKCSFSGYKFVWGCEKCDNKCYTKGPKCA